MSTLPVRDYGKTGVKLSIIGFGGIVVSNLDDAHAKRVVAEAVERGVNYFDVAPSYGNAEQVLGPALEPFRKNVFLACKTTQRDRAGAAAEFYQSLENLRTDHFDLYQLHAIADPVKDVEAAFAKGGVMEMVLEAKKAGQIRFVGFSAHTEEAALAALERYDFDSVLFSVNYANWFKGSFGRKLMARAQQKGAARLALKALARQAWPENDPERKTYQRCWYQPITDPAEASLCLRWTLSQPITAAVTPGDERLFRVAVDLAMDFRPISPAEEAQVRALAEKMRPFFCTP